MAGLEQLITALETLSAAPVEPSLLPRVIRQSRRLDALITRWTSAADQAKVGEASGSSSTAAWLSQAAQVSQDVTERRLKEARALEQLPATAGAVESGAVASAHASALLSATRHLSPEQRAALEPTLLDAALRLDPREFAREARQVVAAASSEAGLADLEQQRAERSLVLARRRDGMYRLSGVLTPEDGQLLRGKLASTAMHDRHDRDDRTYEQKTYDAFMQIVGSSSAATGPRARIVVTTTLSDLGDADAEPGSPAATFADGSSVLRTQLDRLACFAEVRRVVLDSVGVPVDLGRSKRTVSDAQYDALIAIWGGCAGEGCDRPPAWTEAHHVIPWQYGGRTDLSNLVPLCNREHGRVHDGQRAIQLKDGRWIGPRGWVAATEAPGAGSAGGDLSGEGSAGGDLSGGESGDRVGEPPERHAA